VGKRDKGREKRGRVESATRERERWGGAWYLELVDAERGAVSSNTHTQDEGCERKVARTQSCIFVGQMLVKEHLATREPQAGPVRETTKGKNARALGVVLTRQFE
jgi:hypothetical protein